MNQCEFEIDLKIFLVVHRRLDAEHRTFDRDRTMQFGVISFMFWENLGTDSQSIKFSYLPEFSNQETTYNAEEAVKLRRNSTRSLSA